VLPQTEPKGMSLNIALSWMETVLLLPENRKVVLYFNNSSLQTIKPTVYAQRENSILNILSCNNGLFSILDFDKQNESKNIQCKTPKN
jgi:hypothetical protein